MKYLLSLSLLLLLSSSYSQDYSTGIGLRGGWASGLTFKHFISESRALEGILSTGYRYRGFMVTGLYEIHKPAFTSQGAEGLYWYYGPGAHFAGGYHYEHWHMVNNPYDPYWPGYWENHNYIAFGIDFILGLEYKIKEIPFTIAFDVKPFFEIRTERNAPWNFWDAALSVRYVF